MPVGKASIKSVPPDACLRIRVPMAKFAGSAYAPAAKPPPSTVRVWVLFAALVGYAAVGWCVLALVTAFIGDPLAIYLLSTHSNAMRYALPIVPFALLPLLVHIRPPRL